MLSVRKGKKCLCKDKTGTISRKRVVTRVMTIPQCTVQKSYTAAHCAQWRKATQQCTVEKKLHAVQSRTAGRCTWAASKKPQYCPPTVISIWRDMLFSYCKCQSSSALSTLSASLILHPISTFSSKTTFSSLLSPLTFKTLQPLRSLLQTFISQSATRCMMHINRRGDSGLTQERKSYKRVG